MMYNTQYFALLCGSYGSAVQSSPAIPQKADGRDQQRLQSVGRAQAGEAARMDWQPV
jgi:hypothetical protein